MGYLLFAGIPFVVSEAFSASVTQLSPAIRATDNVSDLPFCSAPAPFSQLFASSTTGLCALIFLFARTGWRFLFFGGNAAIEMHRRAFSFILSPEKQLKVSWPQPAATGPSIGACRGAEWHHRGVQDFLFFVPGILGRSLLTLPLWGLRHERSLRYGSPRPGSRGRRPTPGPSPGQTGGRDSRLCGQVFQFRGKRRRSAPLRSLPGRLRLCT